MIVKSSMANECGTKVHDRGQMAISLLKEDFANAFFDPRQCAFATALHRYGFRQVNAGTLEAECSLDGQCYYAKIESVTINDIEINNHGFGFGPVEYKLVKKAFTYLAEPNVVIGITIKK